MNNMLLLTVFAGVFVLINILMILYLRKKDAKLLLPITLLVMVVFLWGIIFDESIKMDEYLMWSICFTIISVVIVLTYINAKKKSKLILAILMVLGAFWLFTFCTETGSVRLAIALKGYPAVAYSTNLVENTYMRKNNISYYVSGKLIETENGTLSFFQCQNYGFLKISRYHE